MFFHSSNSICVISNNINFLFIHESLTECGDLSVNNLLLLQQCKTFVYLFGYWRYRCDIKRILTFFLKSSWWKTIFQSVITYHPREMKEKNQLKVVFNILRTVSPIILKCFLEVDKIYNLYRCFVFLFFISGKSSK